MRARLTYQSAARPQGSVDGGMSLLAMTACLHKWAQVAFSRHQKAVGKCVLCVASKGHRMRAQWEGGGCVLRAKSKGVGPSWQGRWRRRIARWIVQAVCQGALRRTSTWAESGYIAHKNETTHAETCWHAQSANYLHEQLASCISGWLGESTKPRLTEQTYAQDHKAVGQDTHGCTAREVEEP